jgi:hypothetical protein
MFLKLFIRDSLWAVNALECQTVEVVFNNSGDLRSGLIDPSAIWTVILFIQTLVNALFAKQVLTGGARLWLEYNI